MGHEGNHVATKVGAQARAIHPTDLYHSAVEATEILYPRAFHEVRSRKQERW